MLVLIILISILGLLTAIGLIVYIIGFFVEQKQKDNIILGDEK